jgi:cell division protein FtsL
VNAYVHEYQKIERKARRRENFLVRYLPALLVIAGSVVVGKIYLQSVAIEWSHRVMERKELAREIELRNEELVRAIAGLTTRDRVAREAAERLGMVAPSEEDVVWLPVADRAARGRSDAARAGEGPASGLSAWFDDLWQEEALALTSR